MVIQRWQSVLLLCAVVLMGCFSFLSLGQVQTPDYTFNFTALGFFQEGEGATQSQSLSTWYLFAVSILSAVIPLIAIFCYKQGKLQKTLCLITMLLLVCVILVAAQLGYGQFDGSNINWSSEVCAPFISLIAVIVAYQRIKADHRRIAAANRLYR